MNKEIVGVKKTTVLEAFSNGVGLDPVIEQARQVVNEFDHDLTTVAGRKRTASLAAKVAKLKTKLDGMGKDLVADWKSKSKAVDQSRKSMREELDALRDEARKPLSDWEEEQKRIEAEAAEAKRLEELKLQIESDHEIALLLNEKYDREAQEVKEAEEKRKRDYEEKLKQQAAEKAEREKALAIEKAQKEKQEAVERAEREKLQAIAREKFAKEQQEKAERQAIEAKARAEEQAKIAAEQAKQAEIDRQNAEQLAVEEETRIRAANKRHIGNIRKQAKEALMLVGLDESQAKKVVLAISNSEIPNISINY